MGGGSAGIVLCCVSTYMIKLLNIYEFSELLDDMQKFRKQTIKMLFIYKVVCMINWNCFVVPMS